MLKFLSAVFVVDQKQTECPLLFVIGGENTTCPEIYKGTLYKSVS